MKKKKSVNRKKILRIVLLLLILSLLIFTFNSVARLVLLFMFIFVNLLLALGKRLLPKFGISKFFFGIELVMFCTIITSIAFGSQIGAIMGALLMAINYIGERRFSQYFPITLALYAIMGYAAYFFKSYDIVLVGIGFTIAYNLLVTLIVSFFEANKTTMIIFNITNILFNAFLFVSFGRIILNLII